MILLTLLILASGAAGLMYQVLWMRMFGVLLGNTAYAASAVLAGFLLGLALGYLAVGSRRRWLANPLRLYAWLEIGTGVFAIPIPWILSQSQPYYPDLLQALEFTGSSLGLMMLAKVAMALTILLPAAMCMGGTLPALGDAIVHDPAGLGWRGGLIYGCNTAGAMLGGLAAGFWLPASLGVQHTYMLTVGVNLSVGALAWHLSRHPRFLTSRRLEGREAAAPAAGFSAGRAPVQAETHAAGDALHGQAPRTSPAIWRAGLVFAGASGFCILGLEVLWTRMFAQVLQNSVYSYAAIVVTVLAGLAVSAWLVAWSSRYWDGRAALPLTACVAGAATLATPFLFYAATDGLQYQWTSESWGWSLLKLFCLVATVIGPAVIIGGMVLPLVWRLWESASDRPGVVVGKTAAVNTFSGVLGALVAGFLLLPAFGLWRSIMGLACLWFAAAVWAGLRSGLFSDRHALTAGFVGLALAGGAIVWASHPGAFPLVRLDAVRGEQLVEVREGSQGIVAVVDRPQEQDRRLKVDNFYTLGGVAARDNALLQGQLPLLLHPAPKRALFIGSATGIPPAGALSFPVEQIIAVELIPEVIDLARRHFREANRGVYEDPRVRTVAADGRNFLLSTRDRFDVIVADLFIPWHAGAGSMYSQEQFALASSRLTPGGVFCQWLPLYQLSAQEFRLIVATFLEAFPHATLWRGDFLAEQPIVALIGHQNGMPISLDELERRLSRLREAGRLSHHVFRDVAGVLMLYAGNLSQAAGRFAGAPINTDDRPLLEYLAPRIVSTGQDAGRGKQWLVGQPLATFYRQLHADVMELDDPIFPDQTLIHREYRMAGELFYSFNVMTALGHHALAAKVLEQVVELLPESLYPEQAGGRHL